MSLSIVRNLFAALALTLATALSLAAPSGVEIVETANAVLTLKSGSGDLIGLKWKQPKLDLIAEPRLGENFRILLPRPDYEPNYFNSRDQVVRKIDKTTDGVVLHYGPLKNEREQVNVNVVYEIRDTGLQLEFSIRVDNPTDLPLAEVFYAVIGGQQGIGNRLDTESHLPGNASENLAPKLFSQFPLYDEEDIGSGFDAASYKYPGELQMGWIDVYNPKLGVGYYYANQDTEFRHTRLSATRTPHGKSIAPRDNWPEGLPASEPLGLTLGWINFPYTKSGSFRAGPIALKVHAGDWRTAARLHRTWFDQHFALARQPDWLHQLNAWQRLILADGQDRIFHRFADLPKLATEAKLYGVTGMEILGWAVGGLERGYPNYTPDPRLGTIEEFHQALAKMREIGVHPILLANIHLADTSTEDFRTRWSKYAAMGRFAPDLSIRGFAQGTLGARSYGLGTRLRRNFTDVSPAHPEFRKYEMGQYLERVRDGIDGLQFEGGMEGDLDFNPNLHTSPDKSLTQGVLEACAELQSRAPQINPQFMLSTNCPSDVALQYFQVNYNIMGNGMTVDLPSTALQYAFPEVLGTVNTDKPQDYDRLNNGLRYGAIWVVGPRQFTASMDEELSRPMSRYLRELIRIRTQFPDVIFHARFRDMPGANATVIDEQPIASVVGDKNDVRYSMFEPLDEKDPRRAVVVVNFGDQAGNAVVNFTGKPGQKVTVSAPFQPDRTAVLPVQLTLPAHHAAVVVAP